jgi:hypothetical protein
LTAASFERRFGRKNIKTDRHRLEADEERDQIDAARHDHHPRRGAQDEEVILAAAPAFDGEIAMRQQHRNGSGHHEQQLEEDREPVDRKRAACDRHRAGGHTGEQSAGDTERYNRDPRNHRLASRRQENVGDQHEQRPSADGQFRQQVIHIAARESDGRHRPSGFFGGVCGAGWGAAFGAGLAVASPHEAIVTKFGGAPDAAGVGAEGALSQLASGGVKPVPAPVSRSAGAAPGGTPATAGSAPGFTRVVTRVTVPSRRRMKGDG